MSTSTLLHIEKKKIFVPDGHAVYEVSVPNYGNPIQELPVGVEPPQSMEGFTQVQYRQVEIKNPETGELVIYFVKTGEEGLFDELIKVTNAFIQREKNSTLNQFLKHEYPELLNDRAQSERDRIRELPFWRRLFNIF